MAIENKLIEELQPENQEEEQERIIIYQNQEAIYNDIFKTEYFVVGIHLNDIGHILTEEKNIIVKHIFKCECYENTNIYNTSKNYNIEGDNMTIKYIIEELINQNLKEPINNIICNHTLLEGIDPITENNNNIFELLFIEL